MRSVDRQRNLLNAIKIINLNLSDSESEKKHFNNIESDDSDKLWLVNKHLVADVQDLKEEEVQVHGCKTIYLIDFRALQSHESS
jgi:hypothetical protein